MAEAVEYIKEKKSTLFAVIGLGLRPSPTPQSAILTTMATSLPSLLIFLLKIKIKTKDFSGSQF